MTLRLRHLRLRAETGLGRYGADIPLSDGLMVIRADNSRGKSTAVKSLLFALGLERMIATRTLNALTSSLRDRLIYDEDTRDETPVLASWVSLQIEGVGGGVATLTRWVKHEEIGTGLVRVLFGPSLTAPGDYQSVDYYVGRPGAATNPHGFHRWLAEFIGWDMPLMPSSDGQLTQLYMEQVFPLLFVEQRRGWGGIQAQMPYFAGVTDVRRRAIEFLLALDVGGSEIKRQRLRTEERELTDRWRATVRTFHDSLAGEGIAVLRVPETLTVAWPPEHPPVLTESQDDRWLPVDERLVALSRELRKLEASEIPRIEDDASEMEQRLTDALEESDRLRQDSAVMREEIVRDTDEARSIHARIEALREDLREHQDVITLSKLGSSELDRMHDDCPVCHQPLPSTLLGDISLSQATLSAEDTVAYIKQQIELFDVMRRDTGGSLEGKQSRYAALQRRAADVRAVIRALRTTLTAPDGSPSVEYIARRIRLADTVERLTRANERFYGLVSALDRYAAEARRVRAALADIPHDRLSASDQEKLAALQASFIEQLHAYDFGSFSDERLTISQEDYRPRREEFDLQADISASDSIRVVWAYLMGLLEVSGQIPTNHPGLLVFDEPRQQSTKELSFKALLRRAARGGDGRQVIFATSEELTSLQEMLGDDKHTLYAIEGYLLKAVHD